MEFMVQVDRDGAYPKELLEVQTDGTLTGRAIDVSEEVDKIVSLHPDRARLRIVVETL